MKNLIFLIIFNISLFGGSLQVGDLAPNFSLRDQDGNLHQLIDYKENKLVIYFFPKADTPGWIKEACGFRDEFQSFQELNISLLGISYDSIEDLELFREKYNINFNFLSDSEKVVGRAYGVNNYYFFPSRKTFLIDEKGILIHIFDKVNLDTHPKDVLEIFNNKRKRKIKWKYLSNIVQSEIIYLKLPVWKQN